jgi:hypothetical protein
MNFAQMTWFLIGYSIALALVNYAITVLLYNKTFDELIKLRVIRYTMLSSRKGIEKEERDCYIYQGMDESMKTIAYVAKPVVFQFLVLVIALRPIPLMYKGYTLGLNLFGWVPKWFTLYFCAYMLTVQLLSSFHVKEKLSALHEKKVMAHGQ